MISHIAHQKFGTPAEQLVSNSEFREAYPQLPKFFLTADNFAPLGLDEPALLALYKQRKVILLVRDPRDIAVSLYFQLSKRASPLARAVFEMSDNLEEMTLFDFVCDDSGPDRSLGTYCPSKDAGIPGPLRLKAGAESARGGRPWASPLV